MIFYFGVFLFVGTCMSMTSALPPCLCPRDIRPVCGSDGETYNNECLFECERARNQDLTLARLDPCNVPRPLCVCTLEYAPLCGTDGVTYPNKCNFECDHGKAKIAYKGEC